MNSPKFLNYETRPLKFTERKMLLSVFSKICNYYKDDYQYVGFGGLAFTDFKLFHKELHIDAMYSIEGGNFSIEKLEVNCPFSLISIVKDISSKALVDLNFDKKTLIWLDYDGALDEHVFSDLTIVLNKLPIGSIYLLTCNRELKNNDTGTNYTVDEFASKFGDLVPHDITNRDFASEVSHLVIRKMLLNLIAKAVKDRRRINDNIKFEQLFNFVYQENRGAKMYTFGGIIMEESKPIQDLGITNFSFLRYNEDPYKIDPPNLTLREMELLNKNISQDDNLKEIVQAKILSDRDIEKYKSIYRYLPTFLDVRI